MVGAELQAVRGRVRRRGVVAAAMSGWSKVSSGRGSMPSLRMTFCEARLSGVVMATTSRRWCCCWRCVEEGAGAFGGEALAVGVGGQAPADFYGGLREVGDFEAHGLARRGCRAVRWWRGLRGRTW